MTSTATAQVASLRVLARLTKVVESACASADLSLAQYRTLLVLATAPHRFRALCDKIAVRPPTLTGLIDGLEAKGLVRRSRVEGDRRALEVAITDEGREAVTRTETCLAAALGPIFDASGRAADLHDALVDIDRALDEAFDAWLAAQ